MFYANVSSRRSLGTAECKEHLAKKHSIVVSIVLELVSDDRPMLCVEELDVGSLASFYPPVCASIQKLQDVLEQGRAFLDTELGASVVTIWRINFS